jgi:hypothetical protein
MTRKRVARQPVRTDAERRAFLAGLSRDEAAVEAVLRYTRNPFSPDRLPSAPFLPLADEPHVAVWREYAAEAGDGVFGYLRERLPQLRIPVRPGMSRAPAYSRVVYEGEAFETQAFGGVLELAAPNRLRLEVAPHFSGALPVLATDEPEDFRTLYRALGCKSEPAALEPSVHAITVAGFLNWDRIRRVREAWIRGGKPERLWPAELARVAREERWRVQDTIMVLNAGAYSGVSASEAGLDFSEAAWLDVSMALRREHEFTHVATRRLYGLMRNNLLDETLADCMAMVRVLGRFRAASFLAFLGLGDWPRVAETGRIHHYRAGLDGEAFRLLGEVTVRAAAGLERLVEYHLGDWGPERFFLALTRMTQDGLASPQADALFEAAGEATAAGFGPGNAP